jgi:LAS superfamily LD-carboxypeptidase LdcB
MPTVLNALELTGRARTHVREAPAARCTLQPEALAALQALCAAAARVGIDAQPVSSFRAFDHQLAIWNGKFSGTRRVLDRESRALSVEGLGEAERVAAILVWSALPGASRHHWGTDCDLIDRAALPAGAPVELLSADFSPAGRFVRLATWLDEHAAEYGFFRPYDQDRGGVLPEPWHLSYAPLAEPALAAMSPELLRTALDSAPPLGYASLIAQLPRLFERYVVRVAEAPPTARLARALNRATTPA